MKLNNDFFQRNFESIALTYDDQKRLEKVKKNVKLIISSFETRWTMKNIENTKEFYSNYFVQNNADKDYQSCDKLYYVIEILPDIKKNIDCKKLVKAERFSM